MDVKMVLSVILEKVAYAKTLICSENVDQKNHGVKV